MRSIYTLGQE